MTTTTRRTLPRRPARPARPRPRRVRAGPAVPAADRARGRVLHARRRRDARSTWGRSTRRPTACSGSCSSSTARRSSTSTRSSAISTAASRSCARTPTTTRPSATSTRSSTSARCSASGRASWPSRSCSTSRCRAARSTSASCPTELNRIASHSLFLGWMALDLGGLTPILWSFIERDEIVEHARVADRPADALQLLPHRRRQRRPEPRVHEPPRRLDVATRPSRSKPATRSSTRTRSSSAGCAAWASSTRRRRCAWR